jgi:hypothetical protein
MQPAAIQQTSRLSKQECKEKRTQQHATLLALTQATLAQKKDLNVPIKEVEFAGCTILTAAAQHRAFKDILMLALNAGADPNMPDGNKKTPALVAVSHLCTTSFKCVVKSNAQILGQGLVQEICNRLHDTLNMKQAMKRVQMLKCILNQSPNPESKKQLAREIDEHENTALYHLLWTIDPFRNSATTQKTYTEHQRAIFYMQRKKMIRMLLDAGLEVEQKNREGLSAVENINVHPHLKDTQLIGFLMEQTQKNTMLQP